MKTLTLIVTFLIAGSTYGASAHHLPIDLDPYLRACIGWHILQAYEVSVNPVAPLKDYVESFAEVCEDAREHHGLTSMDFSG